MQGIESGSSRRSTSILTLSHPLVPLSSNLKKKVHFIVLKSGKQVSMVAEPSILENEARYDFKAVVYMVRNPEKV